jgi:hypothetical protein
MENATHHYGHDIQLKHLAGQPLLGAPLLFLQEHGVKVSERNTIKTHQAWSCAY